MSLTSKAINEPLTFETKAGKVIEVYMPERQGHGYLVRFKSGGQLPKKLQGLFLTKGEATKAVNAYLASPDAQKKKEKADK